MLTRNVTIPLQRIRFADIKNVEIVSFKDLFGDKFTGIVEEKIK
jgi:hypothetical protein